jgi:hypothetical protein
MVPFYYILFYSRRSLDFCAIVPTLAWLDSISLRGLVWFGVRCFYYYRLY